MIVQYLTAGGESLKLVWEVIGRGGDLAEVDDRADAEMCRLRVDGAAVGVLADRRCAVPGKGLHEGLLQLFIIFCDQNRPTIG